MKPAARCVAAALLATCGLTACSSGATSAKMALVKPGMASPAVHAILGQPARLDHSETNDQTVTGEVDYYPVGKGEGRVIYINGVVFKAEFVAGGKS